MLCPTCHQEIPDESTTCPFCNCDVAVDAPQDEAPKPTKKSRLADKLGVTDWLFFILGLLWPLAGLIVWAVLRESEPDKAQSGIRGAIGGLILSIIIPIVLLIVYFAFTLILTLISLIFAGAMSGVSYNMMM